MTTEQHSLEPNLSSHTDHEDDPWELTEALRAERQVEADSQGRVNQNIQPSGQEAADLELPEPQQIEHVEVAAHGWKARVKRLGSFMLRRRVPNDQEAEAFDAASLLPEQTAEQAQPKDDKTEETDEWPWTEGSYDYSHAQETPEPDMQNRIKPFQKKETVDDGRSVVERLETQRFAKDAPYLGEQVADTSRTNTFQYVDRAERLDNKDPKEGENIKTLTEHEGLVALKDFLDHASEDNLITHKGTDVSIAAGALSEYLTFIGKKEFDEATAGLGQAWKHYLAENPDNTLYIVAGISKSNQRRKSDEYTVESILDTFSEEELAQAGGRIKLGLEDLNMDPDHSKIIYVDDWTMSGSQLHDATANFFDNPAYDNYRKCLEINLVAASSKWINEGLSDVMTQRGTFHVPILAYYKTHDLPELPQPRENEDGFIPYQSFTKEDSPITGIHSSGDFTFEHVISDMVQVERARGNIDVHMPPLTNVVREYRYTQPRIAADANGVLHHVR